MNQLYVIGGSPCSGKSTVAELLQQKYGLTYYKMDDRLFAHMETAARAGKPHSTAEMAMDFEQMWMRPPTLQRNEEIAIYEEIFPYVLEDLAAMGSGHPIIAEGAGFLPGLVHRQGLDAAHYVCIVPTEAFQREKYAQRPWIGQYLADCKDPDKAFDNWMARDALFATEMLRQALALGYTGITVDGTLAPAAICGQVAALFGLVKA